MTRTARFVFRLIVGAAFGATLTTAAAAQIDDSTARNARQLLGADGIGRQLVSLINFSSLPAVSFATFTVDRPDNGRDATLSGGKIPVEFVVPFRDSDIGLQVALSVGLVDFEEPFDLPDGEGGDLTFESERRVISGLVGGGPRFPVLFDDFYITPMIMGGIATIDNEARFFNRAAEILDPNTELFLLNWTVDTTIIAGTLQFDYEYRNDEDWLEVWAQATHSYMDAFNYPDEALNFKGHSDVIGGFVRYNRETDWQVWDQPLG